MAANTEYRIPKVRRGTSLVEVLVVIVVFLIGILAIAQIFPGGFRVLANTRAISVGTTLSSSELRRVQASGQMPEMVIPVLYQSLGGQATVIADPNRTEDNLGPEGQAITQDGDVLDSSGNDLGRWTYLSGLNNIRRIIGEGRVVPPPGIIGNDRGGLFLLEFAPIVYNTNAAYLNLFVYGNDMERTMGNPEPVLQGTAVLPFRYYLDVSTPSDPVLYIPQDPSRAHNFKLVLTAYINSSGVIIQRSYVALPPISVGGAGAPDPYQAVHIAPLVTGPGETLNSIDPDSVKLARVYDQVGTFTNDPYQYKLLDQSLGIILVNGAAFNVIQRTSTGKEVPLEVRADYDVYDWRILKEDFRVPDNGPYEYRLRLQNIKHRNGYEADMKPFVGLNVKVPDETGSSTSLEQRDIIIMDLQTGGLYSKRAFTINYSTGVITFKDGDNNPANGLQVGLMYPGTYTPTTVNAAGRSVRIFYMAQGEWGSQLLKAPDEYTFTQSATPAPGACFVPTSGNIIRFPVADVNKTITIDELWYIGGDGQRHLSRGHAFVVQKDRSATPGNPFITVTDLDPGSQGLDFSNGYAVRGVKGTYVSVRSLYNLGTMSFTSDSAQNISIFEKWLRGWNRTSSESALGGDE